MASEKIWTRFTRNHNGKELKFRIQEVPKDKLESVFGLLFDHYIPEEPLHKAAKITDREESFEELKQGLKILTRSKDYQVDACCLDGDSDELKVVGVSAMLLKEKSEAAIPDLISAVAQTQEVRTFYNICATLDRLCDIMEKYNLDRHYEDRGIVVHPDYRRLGIAGELLKARVVVCKERGITATGAWMAALGSQKAAAKLGWETLWEVDYEELGKQLGVQFNEEHNLCKLMAFKII